MSVGEIAPRSHTTSGPSARRERAWLLRYLSAPEKMRAANDPIALELAKQAKVPMPNLGLTRSEVTELVDYLEGLNHPHH